MAVLSPASETEVSQAVLEARSARTPLEIVAGGTKRNFGRPRIGSESVLDVSRLDGVITYEPDELILTAKPGTRVRVVSALLAANGQRLGFDPPQWTGLFGSTDEATLGGAVSTDSCGPARIRFGSARDQLLGIRAVNGLGEAFKAGGRVVKNVTGFDIPKLACGAFGTLGVLTELTFRVFPKPSQSAVFVVRNLPPEEGFALLRRIWSSPLEATGLGYYPGSSAPASLGDVGRGAALVRVEGEPAPLADKCDQLGRLSLENQFLELPLSEDVFADIGEAKTFSGAPHDVWRVHIPPAEAATFVRQLAAQHWFADWAGSLIWVGTGPDDEDVDQSLRSVVSRCQGHAVLVRASDLNRGKYAFPHEGAARTALTRAVKAAFDPLGLFNPGRMYEGV